MAKINIKQINNTPANEGGIILYDGSNNVWSNNDDGAILVSKGTTAQRPGTPTEGMIRYNIDTDCLEAYVNGSWTCLDHTVDIEEDDVSVATNITTLNFEGDVGVTDEGSGKVTVNIAPSLSALLSTTPTAQVTRTTSYVLTNAFADVTFDRTDVETTPSILEHDNINTEQIDIKEDGLYFIAYGLSYIPTNAGLLTTKVVKNNTTDIPGSIMDVDDSNDQQESSKCCAVSLSAGDYITLQAKKAIGAGSLDSEITLVIFKLDGIKGEKGDTGSGSSITIQEDDITVPGGPHDTINFEGNVSVANDGGGKATVTVGITGLATYQITGDDSQTSEPILFITDTTRSNKVLSVESSAFFWSDYNTGVGDWLAIGLAISSDIGYIMPYDGTIIRAAGMTTNGPPGTANIQLYIDAANNGTILSFTGLGEQHDTNTDLDLNFSAGDKIRLQNTGLALLSSEVEVSVWVKWRVV